MRIVATAVAGALTASLLAGYVTTAQSPVILAVAGRSNETPSIDGSGRFAVVTWSARSSSGTDVFVASSRDAGLTFSMPARANDMSGSASVSGEQPPRVSLVTRPGGEPSIVVAWTAKGSGGTR